MYLSFKQGFYVFGTFACRSVQIHVCVCFPSQLQRRPAKFSHLNSRWGRQIIRLKHLTAGVRIGAAVVLLSRQQTATCHRSELQKMEPRTNLLMQLRGRVSCKVDGEASSV